MKANCSVPGCDRPHKSLSFCPRHLYQFHKYGKIISPGNLHDRNRKCSVPGCERKHRGLGYCYGHYQQFRKHGEILREVVTVQNGISRDQGYVYLLNPLHPAANKKGRVKRCNIVWEENTGQIVMPPAVVHHKNGIREDDSFDNLEYCSSQSAHEISHHIMKGYRGFVSGGIYNENNKAQA